MPTDVPMKDAVPAVSSPPGDLLSDELVDELLAGARTPEELTGPGGLLAQLTKRLVERAMSAELDDHLGYPRGSAPRPDPGGNSRNGSTPKTLHTDHGSLRLDGPRDRDGSFEPQIVKKGQRRFDGFDEKIVALYARGLSVRDIQAHLQEIYGVEVGHDLISRVTDAVLEDVKAWQARPLEEVYPIVFLDALVVKIRDHGVVRNKHAYLAIGVNGDGEREVLGIWIEQTEGAKFWLSILTELKQRGVQDVLVCCVDGLKGFPEAIETVWPQAVIQTCVVHLIRHSLRFVAYRDKKKVAADLRAIYTAASAEAALSELEQFAERWDEKFPMISASWKANWELVSPFLAFPPDLRRVVYTTNTIEALNRQIRKTIKTRGQFPTDDAARKLLYLAIINAEKKWHQTYNWTSASAAFKIHFGDRYPH